MVRPTRSLRLWVGMTTVTSAMLLPRSSRRPGTYKCRAWSVAMARDGEALAIASSQRVRGCGHSRQHGVAERTKRSPLAVPERRRPVPVFRAIPISLTHGRMVRGRKLIPRQHVAPISRRETLLYEPSVRVHARAMLRHRALRMYAVRPQDDRDAGDATASGESREEVEVF